MLTCNGCGEVFDEDELVAVALQSGEAWGVPYTEWGRGCPCCRGFDYKEEEKNEHS